MGPASERRRFLDRLVLAVDAEHPAGSTRSSARCARATGCWRSRAPIRTGSTPSSTRPPSWRSRSPRSAPKPCAACKARWRARQDDAFPSAEIALDGWMERLLPDHPAVEIEERYRGVLKDNRARDAAAGRTLDGPHLTDLARDLCAQEHSRRRRLDRRAEGAADRARAGARRTAGRDDRLRAGAAARRGGGASRSRPPRARSTMRSARSARRSS